MPSKFPLQITQTFRPLTNDEINDWRVIAMRAALAKALFEAKKRSTKQMSPFSPGRVSGRLFESIHAADYYTDGRKKYAGLLYVKRGVAVNDGRSYASFQEYGTGRYRGGAYIRPKTKKAMMWIQTIRWHLGRRGGQTKWQSADRTAGQPYKGKHVHPRYVGSVLYNQKGRSTQRRADMAEQWQIYATKTKGVQAKYYLRDSMANNNPIWISFRRELRTRLTRDTFPKFVTNVPNSWNNRRAKYSNWKG